MKTTHVLGLAVAITLLCGAAQAAPTFFDNFNTNEGHFNQHPTYSGTSNVDTSSTADRTTAAGEYYEGTGAEKLVLIQKAGGALPQRCRFLSGIGNPANNISFPITAGTDGWIGFYYKVGGTLANAAGMQLTINLDDAANNSGPYMDSGVLKDAINDGQWHLVEWNLDNPADWVATPAIGGDGILTPGTNRTIDSVYFYNLNFPGTPVTVFMDFVAKTDEGSVATLVCRPDLPAVTVSSATPLMTNDTAVTVTGVDPAATKVTVYAVRVAGLVEIGSNASPGGSSTVLVTVQPLISGEKIVASQWKTVDVGNIESCVPLSGPVVDDCNQVGAVSVGGTADILYEGKTTVSVFGVIGGATKVVVFADAAEIGNSTTPTSTTIVDVSAHPLVNSQQITALQYVPGRQPGSEFPGCPSAAVTVGDAGQIPLLAVGMVSDGQLKVAVGDVHPSATAVTLDVNGVLTDAAVISSPHTVVDLSSALVAGQTVKARQTVYGIVGNLSAGRRVAAAGILEDFNDSYSASAAMTTPPRERTWYNVKDDSYTVPYNNRTDIDGTKNLTVTDHGNTNGVYAVYDNVFTTAGTYHLQVQMWVDERDVDPDFYAAYQVGVKVNGAHRAGGQLLENILTSGGKYLGPLTPAQNGVGASPPDDPAGPHLVYSDPFSANPGDSLQIAFSCAVHPTLLYHAGKAAAGGTYVGMQIDNIKLVSGTPPCFNWMVPVVSVNGPLEEGGTQVNVRGIQVDGLTTVRASKVTAYRYDGGTSHTKLGEIDPQGVSEIAVTITEIDPATSQPYKLKAGWTIVATQTAPVPNCGSMEGVKATTGPIVGLGEGGLTPLKITLGIRETAPTTCPPVGGDGGTSGAIEWLGAATKNAGGAPQGKDLLPTSGWQTVSFYPVDPDGGGPLTADPVLSFNAGNGVLSSSCYVFEHLAFSITTATPNSGRYLMYIDNIKSNGVTVADFEDGVANALYMFNVPTNSGTTSGNLLADPNEAAVASPPVDYPLAGSTKSLKVQWQFDDVVDKEWLRLTTVAAATAQPHANPAITVDGPITMDILFLGAVCNNPFADADGDGDVDQADFAAFQECYTGNAFQRSVECSCFDHVKNNYVDSDDLGVFNLCASGPGISADLDCD